ncbi:MAG: acetoacetyl-CoA reductase [Alphaproteobacteria bacterium]
MAYLALVTGGTRGIGAAIAVALRDAGHTVVANYAGNDKAAQEFSSRTGITVHKWDVGDAAACATGLAEVEAAHGPVEILVNNAGITRDAMLHRATVEKWDEVIRVNLSAMFYMTQPLIAGMRDRGFGRIINITSINGEKGQMGQTNYSAAKAGIIGFTKALAQETAAKGITVNAVAPGYIGTEMVTAMPEKIIKSIVDAIPMRRLGEPAEIAALVAFLAGQSAGFITGATFDANGGQYMR